MIGAVRWGRMSIVQNHDELILDHDFDFLVQMPKRFSVQDALSLLEELREGLEDLGFTFWNDLNCIFNSDGLVPMFDRTDCVIPNPSGAYHFSMFLRQPRFRNVVSRLRNADPTQMNWILQHLQRHVQSNYHHLIVDNQLYNGEWNPTLRRTNLTARDIRERFKRWSSSHAIPTDVFEIDFWLRIGERWDSSYYPDPGRKSFFHGPFISLPEGC